jgi:hypothetical protein
VLKNWAASRFQLKDLWFHPISLLNQTVASITTERLRGPGQRRAQNTDRISETVSVKIPDTPLECLDSCKTAPTMKGKAREVLIKVARSRHAAARRKRVFDLVMRFGTSKSPKRPRSSTVIDAPAALRPRRSAIPLLCSVRLRTAPAYGWTPFSDACFVPPFGAQAHVGQTVSPRGYRGLRAFASLSLARSGGRARIIAQALDAELGELLEQVKGRQDEHLNPCLHIAE